MLLPIIIGVTILILIDGFLQYTDVMDLYLTLSGHNPYFNRWFSAIEYLNGETAFVNGHNPYFNRWFSAI